MRGFLSPYRDITHLCYLKVPLNILSTLPDWHHFPNRVFLPLAHQETSGHMKEAGTDRSWDVGHFLLSALHVNISPLKGLW